ncbi:hypothetical protein PV10_07699 [Exophiala mesophila]|uniref:Uncharacterized protein n=1 Tax=Exophiala mesophila TaxID=212818 RepID=A0A0D1WMY9_EXOME|nr:uncharacterized protein PV10_07699 [Exophiala mesophila]KIV90390.1 hypothetical protein PV10_07699 [Exophiala mesophila]
MGPTAPKAPKVSPSDLATNEALLAYADASRLARSWLSAGSTTSDHQGTDQEAEPQEDEALNGLEKFTQEGYSDNGGVGFVVSPSSVANGSTAGTGSTGHDAATSFLRTQMLGKSFRSQQQRQGHNPNSRQPKWNHRGKGGQIDDDDESESRSHVAKSKPRPHQRQEAPNKVVNQHAESSSDTIANQSHSNQSDELGGGPSTSGVNLPASPSTTPVSRKRAKASYLDEILAQRAAKKNKKASKSS